MSHFERLSTQAGFQKLGIADGVQFDLRKVPLHVSNESTAMKMHAEQVFRLLTPHNESTVSVRCILFVLTHIYEFWIDGLDEAFAIQILRKMNLPLSAGMTLLEFFGFLDSAANHRTTVAYQKRLKSAWSTLFTLLLVFSALGSVVTCAVYFSSDSPPHGLIYVLAGLAAVFTIGCFFLFCFPVGRLLWNKLRVSQTFQSQPANQSSFPVPVKPPSVLALTDQTSQHAIATGQLPGFSNSLYRVPDSLERLVRNAR